MCYNSAQSVPANQLGDFSAIGETEYTTRSLPESRSNTRRCHNQKLVLAGCVFG